MINPTEQEDISMLSRVLGVIIGQAVSFPTGKTVYYLLEWRNCVLWLVQPEFEILISFRE